MRTTTTPRPRARATVATLGAAALALTLAACGGADEATPGVTAETVTIGTHQPLTGPAAAGYSSISAATQAYFDHVNAQGGVHGRQIEYVVKDDGYNPANTQTVVRELVQQDDVFAVVNGLGTPTHSAVLDFLNQNEVPDLFVSSGSTAWDDPEAYPYTFGYNADYHVEGAALGRYAADEHPGETVCLLGQNDDYGETLLEGVQIALGEDGVAAHETYETANQDVTAQIGALQGAGCEVVVLGTVNGFTALAVGTAAQMGFTPTWMAASAGGDYPTLVGFLGEDLAPVLLQGFVSVNYLPFGPGGDWVELFSAVNDEYNAGAPFDGNTVFGMSVGYTFVEALARAGEDPTRESLVAALESGDVVGNGLAPLAYSADDHAGFTTAGITVVDDGVQDFVGTTYRLDGETVTTTEPQVPAVEGEGVPTE
ncbi:ABC-type branched-subunit amino acid transport system substrate-binding protein [Isoptericola jiangsuensis]|uniref:ABC-type branched-subunit amino acid transport system substrate-binding protein n=1 Tax=Isoptericola jiangsuensis TaxID=548579 RepID=A0A2A9EVD8_9MICO|nr:ABC transporter substrate-binding protein [Isoptericola jiangsuensis]PFG42994.1 ABC-type branched-subunit amino acid transport system substrate-binding protein [Isoptericola jiangsuensis]